MPFCIIVDRDGLESDDVDTVTTCGCGSSKQVWLPVDDLVGMFVGLCTGTVSSGDVLGGNKVVGT